MLRFKPKASGTLASAPPPVPCVLLYLCGLSALIPRPLTTLRADINLPHSTSHPKQNQTFPCISQNISLSITGLGTKDSSSPEGGHILASIYLSLAALHMSRVQILPFLCLLRLHILIRHISPNAESQKAFTLCDVLNENGTHRSYV